MIQAAVGIDGVPTRSGSDMADRASGKTPFYVELIKPSHYDDEGYVIQWQRAWSPSNSLACLYGLALDVTARGARCLCPGGRGR